MLKFLTCSLLFCNFAVKESSVFRMETMEKDAVFEMAERYVKGTGRSVFLTGKAGTGKTTFLRYITRTIAKRFVVLAPTGVAAINAGGSTIHSFFQLPLCPYLPDVKELVTEYQMPEKYRSLRKERIKILRTLDLLIIDEISMVRADLLDAVDMTLRRYRRNDRPFGGVQLLMIGDAQQLSPVVRESERQFMSRVYPSPYFFHSKALRKIDYVTIELTRVHRQKDAAFLEILNSIRENKVTQSLLDTLNSRVDACREDDDIIRLTTHNAQADDVNRRRLEELDGEAVQFAAEIEGDFPENSYPADEILTLKKGAQVMFIRNDPEGEYYNGKIGRVEEIVPGTVVSVSDSDGNLITVVPSCWENTRYVLDEGTKEIRPEVEGTFRQLPLRIAWAITIHKSQGLTFDKVIIDAGAAFAFGQVYVALSRCRTIEGISLDTPVTASSIYSDIHVADFNATIPSAESVKDRLASDERGYLYDQLREVFDLEGICRGGAWLRRIWREHLDDIYPDEYQLFLQLLDKLEQARKTADAFRNQITKIQMAGMTDDSFLNERLEKAAGYFRPLLEEFRSLTLRMSSLEIDNKEVRKKVKESSDELMVGLDIACRTMELILRCGFIQENYGRIRTDCMLEDRTARQKKLKKIERTEGEQGIVNEELRERLQAWRTERFKADNVPAYTIMHQTTLMDIASLIPKTKAELLRIKGFGEARYNKYGEQILKITAEF